MGSATGLAAVLDRMASDERFSYLTSKYGEPGLSPKASLSIPDIVKKPADSGASISTPPTRAWRVAQATLAGLL